MNAIVVSLLVVVALLFATMWRAESEWRQLLQKRKWDLEKELTLAPKKERDRLWELYGVALTGASGHRGILFADDAPGGSLIWTLERIREQQAALARARNAETEKLP